MHHDYNNRFITTKSDIVSGQTRASCKGKPGGIIMGMDMVSSVPFIIML